MRCSSRVLNSATARIVCVVAVSYLAGSTIVAQEPQPAEAAVDFEAKVRAALDKPGDWEFIDTPLSDVVDYLGDKLGIDVLLDKKALEDLGVDVAQPVNLMVRGVSARSALQLMLQSLDLSYTTHDEALWITTPEKLESALISRVYPVGELLHSTDGSGEEGLGFDQLIGVITTTISPDSWDDVGGPGTIEAIYGALAVSQTRDVHDQIEGLLNACKQLINSPPAGSESSVLLFPGETEVDGRIRAALQKAVNGEFSDATLQDVAAYLSEATEIPILLDSRALEDLGIDPATPVSVAFSELALQHALRRILQELELTFVVRNEVLLITTPESAEASQVVGIYPVEDLVVSSPEEADATDFDTLINTIEATVRPDTWDNYGGPGTLDCLVHPRNCLVIGQTEQIHEEISALLAKLRWAKKVESERAKTADDSPEKPHVRVYALRPLNQQLVTPESLIPLITRELGEETWTTGDGVYLQTLGLSLVVKHKADVHRRIGSFLKTLGVWNSMPQQPQGFGGATSGLPAGQQPGAGGMGGFGGGGMGGFGGGMGGGGGGYFSVDTTRTQDD